METRIDEVGHQLYRIATPVDVAGGFSFNQYLLVDEQPLLFHTGGRGLFPSVSAAIDKVMPLAQLRWISFSHVEADECGALNHFLAAAPQAQPLCGQVAAMVSMNDLADRAPRALGNGETLSIGKRAVTWIDAPHVPHAWECGFLFEGTDKTLFCGDLFTQGGTGHKPLTDGDILEPSEGFRKQMDYYAHAPHTAAILEQLAATEPSTLACMHGSAFRGDGGRLIRALAQQL